MPTYPNVPANTSTLAYISINYNEIRDCTTKNAETNTEYAHMGEIERRLEETEHSGTIQLNNEMKVVVLLNLYSTKWFSLSFEKEIIDAVEINIEGTRSASPETCPLPETDRDEFVVLSEYL